MLNRRRSRDASQNHGVGPTNFSKQQMCDYLADLRNNRPTKPVGSRPQPQASPAAVRRSYRSDEPSPSRPASSKSAFEGHSRSSSSMSSHYGTGSVSEKMCYNSVRDPKHRRAEKEESHAVRVAMDALHFQDNSQIPKTASEEASELLRKHQQPHAPYATPEHVPPRFSTPTDSANIEYDADGTRYRNGMEIRSEDIRAATTRSLRERSPNLPSPAFVSDHPGRPIVSFSKNWKPPEAEPDVMETTLQQRGPTTQNVSPLAHDQDHRFPIKSVSAPAVPTLRDMDEANAVHNMRAEAPSIAIFDEFNAPSVPEIHVDEDSGPPDSTPFVATPSTLASNTPPSVAVTPTPKPRPSGAARARPSRPAPRHAVTAPTASTRTPHAMRSGSTLCAQCALPIYGRTVTAAGTRFHPECFVCFHCGEHLECVQFYPEPTASRDARQERIEMRLAGEDVEPPEGLSMDDDNDDSLRFYCHLDYHEFFSPRCKTCKTPIEGEMVVALGVQYHPGHFFCANCGDPFDQDTPFVEKDGYAWCVNCHHTRTSGRCKKCKRPVTDMVLKALDAEWHEECFRCTECNGPFEDGRYFLRDEALDPFCSACEARRLKS